MDTTQFKMAKTTQYSYGDRWYTVFHSDGTKDSYPFPLNVSSFPKKDMYGNPLPKHLQYQKYRELQRDSKNDRYSFGEKGYTIYHSNGDKTYRLYKNYNDIPPVDMYDKLRPDLDEKKFKEANW